MVWLQSDGCLVILTKLTTAVVFPTALKHSPSSKIHALVETRSITLEIAMRCAPHQSGALRIRGIWAMGKGMGREEVALFCNVDPKTVLE